MITAKLFTLLGPFGSLAFRVSLFSGILALLTTCLVYGIVYRIFDLNLYVPTFYNCETFTFMHEFEGQVLNLMGRCKDTTLDFPRVTVINPDYHSTTRARACFETSQYPSAIFELEGYLISNPGDAEAYFWLGEIYFSQKEYGSASTALKKAVGIKPDSPKTRYLYGLALKESGHAGPAVVQFKKTIQLYPNSGYAKNVRRVLDNTRGP